MKSRGKPKMPMAALNLELTQEVLGSQKKAIM